MLRNYGNPGKIPEEIPGDITRLITDKKIRRIFVTIPGEIC